MAKISDIITKRGENYTVPDSVYAVRDTTSGATDERYTNNVINALGGVDNMPNWIEEVEVVDEPIVPSLAVFFATAGISDDKAKKEGYKDAKDMFVNGYAKHVKAWNKKIEKNPVLGSQGVKTFKDLWTRAVYDDADEKVKEARKNLGDAKASYGPLNGIVPDFLKANIPGSEFITKMAFPRTTERLANTGDFDAKDIALDLGENGLMMIPGAGWTKAGGAVARKVAPSLVLKTANEAKKLANSGSRIAPYIPKAVTMARNVGANAIVPFMAEKADDIAYDVGEGMDDRANFDWGDAVVGTAINQAVNQGLLRDMLPLVTRYGGVDRKANSATKRGIRDFIATIGQSRKKIGQDVVNEAADVVNSPVVRAFPEGTQVTENELRGLTNGVNIIPEGVTVDEYLNAKRIAAVADLIDKGKVGYRTPSAIASAFKKNQNDKRYVEKLILGMRSEAGDTWRQAMKQTDHAKRAELMIKAEQLNHDAKGLETILGDDKITSGATPSDILKGVAGTHNPVKNQMPREVVREVINQNPELYNYAYWKNAPWYANVENAVHQAWPSLVVNKAGKTDYASDVVRATKDITEQNRKESKEQSKKAQVSKIISARPELSSTDLKWLNAIKENPDIVKNGYNKGSVKDADDFKMWLLLGGNDLLRGSDVHRPLWDIE
jgi:hypothetical protein